MSNIRMIRPAGRRAAAVLGMAVLWAAAAVPAHAQENKAPEAFVSEEELDDNVWVTLSLPFYNKYYYRGIELYPDTSFQPSLSFSYLLGEYGTLGASVWAHIPVGNNQDRFEGFDEDGNLFNVQAANEFVEVDPAIYYDITFDDLTFAVGHLWYTDPAEGSTSFIQGGEVVETSPAAPDTAEVFGSVSLDTFGSPNLTVYHDYRRFEYQYYALSFSQRIDAALLGPIVGESFNVTPYVLFGFATNGEKVYNDESGLKHVNVGVRSTVFLGSIRVTPILQFNFGADESLDGVERTEDDLIMGIDFAYDAGFSL